MHKIIVMSDLHLVASGKKSHEIDTIHRLSLALDHISEFHSDAQACVFAGDLADHGEPGAYEQLRDALKDYPIPVYFTLGNHDDRASFISVFGADQARFDHSFAVGAHQVIVLDSQDPGKVSGDLDASQLAWLEAELAAAKDRPVIVVLHHPVVDLCTGLDFILLKDSGPLLSRLAAHGNVQQVISGHVHFPTSGITQGVPFATLGGNHYGFQAFSSTNIADMSRTEGPGQIGVLILCENATVLHFDNFLDRHRVMDPALFVWEE